MQAVVVGGHQHPSETTPRLKSLLCYLFDRQKSLIVCVPFLFSPTVNVSIYYSSRLISILYLPSNSYLKLDKRNYTHLAQHWDS